MKKTLIVIGLLLSAVVNADEFNSARHKVSLLELYTSEGCSSCPPAESWLSRLKQQQASSESLVALAFHVSYWDYLGWKDPFSSSTYDLRQRTKVKQQGGRTVYTPQFFFNGKTLRSTAFFSNQVQQAAKSDAALSIKAELTDMDTELLLSVAIKPLDTKLGDQLRLNVALYQNDITSSIKAGENKGRVALHQYVVRDLQAAVISINQPEPSRFKFKKAQQQWHGMVIFVESETEVLQVLEIVLKKRT
ncbi:MAG: DUF1223 domain-containing protein [Gammaproteobacteria bacterium]|nr:DUF1223 domain-containing protein [Gammaproteobacteria bacterium]